MPRSAPYSSAAIGAPAASLPASSTTARTASATPTTPQPPGAATDAIIARIASVTIKGLVLGTAAPVGDHFGFTAQQIGSFSVSGTKLALTPGTDAPFPLAPLTSDVALREVG